MTRTQTLDGRMNLNSFRRSPSAATASSVLHDLAEGSGDLIVYGIERQAREEIGDRWLMRWLRLLGIVR